MSRAVCSTFFFSSLREIYIEEECNIIFILYFIIVTPLSPQRNSFSLRLHSRGGSTSVWATLALDSVIVCPDTVVIMLLFLA
jgi:hypothetical protein